MQINHIKEFLHTLVLNLVKIKQGRMKHLEQLFKYN